MAYQKIATVSIGLQTSGVSRASFGIPMFISDHFWFTERSRSYTDLEGVAADVPTDSDAYAAAVQAFSQTEDPAIFKLGRREADDITFTPEPATAAGQEYKISVKGTDGVTVDASFVTTTGSETATTITADLAADLDGVVTGVTVVDNLGTITLSKAGTDDFAVTAVERHTYVTTTTESAADMMNAITAEDDDFYFVTCNDHSDAFIMALAADIEARIKQYFVSVQDVANLAAYSDVATFTMAKVKQGNYFRTSVWFHQEANTVFPEVQYVVVAAPADPGKKIWGNNRVAGLTVSKNTTTGLVLSTTEKGNITDSNGNFTENVGGLTITRRGMVGAGEWIDVIRNRDFLEARITEAYQNLLINKPVVPYTDAGISTVRSTLTQVLDRYVETDTQPNILEAGKPYTISFKNRIDTDVADVTAREFNGDFVAYLSGAIQIIKITGSLQYRQA